MLLRLISYFQNSSMFPNIAKQSQWMKLFDMQLKNIGGYRSILTCWQFWVWSLLSGPAALLRESQVMRKSHRGQLTDWYLLPLPLHSPGGPWAAVSPYDRSQSKDKWMNDRLMSASLRQADRCEHTLMSPSSRAAKSGGCDRFHTLQVRHVHSRSECRAWCHQSRQVMMLPGNQSHLRRFIYK